MSLKQVLNIAVFILINFLFTTTYGQDVSAPSHVQYDIKRELSVGNNKYIYELLRDEKLSSQRRDKLGRITIYDTSRRDNSKVYEEISIISPVEKNGSFPVLSKLPIKQSADILQVSDAQRWFVAFYGNCGGQNNTIKVFFNHQDSLMSATLSYSDALPNLEDKDGDGEYEAQVLRRLSFEDGIYGQLYYLQIYKLKADANTFGFVLSFDKRLSTLYSKYYFNLKKYIQKKSYASDKNDVGPMLAALFSTRDKLNIQSEIIFVKEYFSLDEKEIDLWKNRLEKLGFPICE